MEIGVYVGEAEFRAYEQVRQSNVTNMFDLTTVSALSGLTKAQVRGVMDNYKALRERFGDGQ